MVSIQDLSFSNYRNTILSLLEKQQWQLALESCEKLTKAYPNRIQGYVWKGNALIELEKYEQAEVIFKQLRQEHPENMQGLRGLALVAVRSSQWQLAIERCGELIQAHPQHIQSYVWKGNALIKLEKYEQAEVIFKQLRQEHPENMQGLRGLALVAVRSSQRQLAIERCNKLIQVHPQCIHGYLWKGNILDNLSRPREASILYRQAMELFPASQIVYIRAAAILQRRGKQQDALAILEDGLSKVENDIYLLGEKVSVLLEIGNIEEAKHVLSNILKKYPEDKIGLIKLAQLSEKDQDFHKAISLWRSLLSRFPDDEISYERIGQLLMMAGDLREAEQHYEAIYPSKPLTSLLGLTQLYAQEGTSVKCIDLLNFLIDINHEEEAYPRLIMILMERGELSKIILEVENYYKYLIKSETMYSLGAYQLIRAVFEASEKVDIESFWLEYTSIVEAYEIYHLSIDKDVFPLRILSIVFVQKALLKNRLDFANNIAVFVAQHQNFFQIQHLLLSTIYEILGRFFVGTNDYGRAISHLRYSLRIIPENQHRQAVVKQTISEYHSEAFNSKHPSACDSSVAIMILTCEKHQEKINILREKIYSRLGVSYYFVIGMPDLKDDWKQEGDILYVRSPDNYESLAQKVLKAYEFFDTCCQHSGIIKLDDDIWIPSFARLKSFIEWLEQHCSNDYLGVVKRPISRTWHFYKCQESHLNTVPYAQRDPIKYWCAGGWGYFLSRKSISVLADYSLKYGELSKGEPAYEDIVVAKILCRGGITPKHFNFVDYGLIQIEQDPRLRILNREDLLKEAAFWQEKRNTSKALECYQQACAIEPELSLKEYCAIRKLLIQEGKVILARSMSKLALTRFPESRDEIEAWLN